jgi:8-oxo-dGTP pyrophosphatase MutT (NUDIX family)
MKLFIEFLEKRLNYELPGINSHIKMAPKILEKSFRNFESKPNAKQSAVLIPLVCKNELNILLTLRSSNLRSHSGQISFPGGRLDPGESGIDAALRETYEEIGIKKEDIKIIGKLSDLYVPPSNNLIFPYIGIIKNEPELVLNECEVEECFYVPITHFIRKENTLISKEKIGDYIVDMPHWVVNPKAKLWGATSMILQELIDLYTEWLNY